jgi:cellulose synthase/poly-beta-1,6-N-acetylglucosamine synthase-like glycosyltransferase
VRIGDLMVRQDYLKRERLEALAASATRPLGESLYLRGALCGRTFAETLSAHTGHPRVDLWQNKPDAALFHPRDLAHYRARHFIPFAREGDMLVLATAQPSEILIAWARRHYAQPVRLIICSPRELESTLNQRSRAHGLRLAKARLRRLHPGLTADRVLLSHQRRGLLLLAALLTLSLALFPQTGWTLLIIAANVFYVASLAFKLLLFGHGLKADAQLQRTAEMLAKEAAALPDNDLPIYSILVPLYQEAPQVLIRLLKNLHLLDYPKDKLEVLLITEADDVPTLSTLKALKPPAYMRIVEVPTAQPRTKPKACNYALPLARGEFCVIYDAEDCPARDQLKRAVALFRKRPEIACLQAPLNYFNRDECLLSQLFALEYSALFRMLLPGLERLQLPIPLGGTSNHMRTAVLNTLGGWDAYNVTEDADLGVRLHYYGHRTAILPSLTLEESPIHLRAWLKQRTRWIKGYLQTWFVYTRDRVALRQRLGTPAYYGFQFFVGAPALTFLIAPIFWLALLTSWLIPAQAPLSAPMQWLCAVSFVGGMLMQWLYARQVLKLEGWSGMHRAFALFPFYWMLHSLAALRALTQLIIRPHYWDKTRHGLTRVG